MAMRDKHLPLTSVVVDFWVPVEISEKSCMFRVCSHQFCSHMVALLAAGVVRGTAK